MTDVDEAGWDDPDRAVQIEDDNPEALAGVECEFDEAADDENLEVFDLEGERGEREDFPSDPVSSRPAAANLPVEGA